MSGERLRGDEYDNRKLADFFENRALQERWCLVSISVTVIMFSAYAVLGDRWWRAGGLIAFTIWSQFVSALLSNDSIYQLDRIDYRLRVLEEFHRNRNDTSTARHNK